MLILPLIVNSKGMQRIKNVILTSKINTSILISITNQFNIKVNPGGHCKHM